MRGSLGLTVELQNKTKLYIHAYSLDSHRFQFLITRGLSILCAKRDTVSSLIILAVLYIYIGA